jgi:hypothetical protein
LSLLCYVKTTSEFSLILTDQIDLLLYIQFLDVIRKTNVVYIRYSDLLCYYQYNLVYMAEFLRFLRFLHAMLCYHFSDLCMTSQSATCLHSSSTDTGKGRSKLSSNKVTHGFHLVEGKSGHDMEDYHVAEYKCEKNHELGLFAIFDGHLGDRVPSYLRANLFCNILKEVMLLILCICYALTLLSYQCSILLVPPYECIFSLPSPLL